MQELFPSKASISYGGSQMLLRIDEAGRLWCPGCQQQEIKPSKRGPREAAIHIAKCEGCAPWQMELARREVDAKVKQARPSPGHQPRPAFTPACPLQLLRRGCCACL